MKEITGGAPLGRGGFLGERLGLGLYFLVPLWLAGAVWPVLTNECIPAPLPGGQMLQWTVEIMCISEGPGRGSFRSRSSSSKSWTNSIKHRAATSTCSESASILPFAILHGRRWSTMERIQTLEHVKPGPTSCLYHWLPAWPWTTVKTRGLSWRFNKITCKRLPWCLVS